MVKEHKEQSWLMAVSLVILAVVALATALIYTRAVMIPFVVAVFIVALVSPVEDFQVKRLKLPRIFAVIVTLLVVLSVISLVFVFVYQATQTIVSTAGDYSASFAYMANKLLESVEYIYRVDEEEPVPPVAPNDARAVPDVSAKSPPQALDDFNEAAVAEEGVESKTGPPEDFSEAPIPRVQAGQSAEKVIRQIIRDLKNYIFNIVTNAFGTIFGLMSGVFFVCIFVIFLLVGRNPYAEHSQVYTDIVQKIRRYVGIKVAISAMTGVLVWAILSMIGLKLAGLFGILAFLLNFIPSIGSIIATLLPIPIAVAQFQSPWLVILVIAVPGVVQNTLGNIIEPKLMGEGLNLHPVTVLLALSFWGLLWGIVGMFLAAPITAAIRIVLMQFDMLRPIGDVLAGDFSKIRKTGG